MIFATIWIGGRSGLIIMKRDPDGPPGGYTTKSNLDLLEDGLLLFYEADYLYHQDNTETHPLEAVGLLFETHDIHVTEWPPHSPDLNPTEPVWGLLKRELFRRYPSLANGRRRNLVETSSELL